MESDGASRLWILGPDHTNVYAVVRDHREPNGYKQTRFSTPEPIGVYAGSAYEFFALSLDGKTLVHRRETPVRRYGLGFGLQMRKPEPTKKADSAPPPEPEVTWTRIPLSRAIRGAYRAALLWPQKYLVVGAAQGLFLVERHAGQVRELSRSERPPVFALDGPRDLIWLADRESGAVTLARLQWGMRFGDGTTSTYEAGPAAPAGVPAVPVLRAAVRVSRVTALPEAEGTFPPPPYKDGLICVEYIITDVYAGSPPPSNRLIGAVTAYRHGRLMRSGIPQVGARQVVSAVPIEQRRDEMTLPLLDDIQELEAPLYFIVEQTPQAAR
jgi:hypothetical protein